MLLRFRVANVRSLRDEQELSFVVPQGEESDAARLLTLSDGKSIQVYPLLGIFGANASGKSNVIVALKKMKEAVLGSYAQWTSYQGIPREEFALDPKSAAESTFYEADFVLDDGVRWTYGFELGPRVVESEWLHAYPKGRRQVWLDRDATRDNV
ncbi:ATP/GTP-binding protein [Streptomyces sp. NPDC087263]|uniref:AAA family ATPase n=1 Tax=Streptomyces sp. NPDC087263 TaxID=3365773 RepID=UPI00380E678C